MILQQSSTSRVIMILLVSSGDHITPVTGATLTVTLSKNGAAFASPAGTVAEVANGWYKLTPTSADTGTLGPLVVHATATSADPVDIMCDIVAYDPYSATNLGLSALPTATAGANGGLPLGDASGRVLLQPTQSGVTIPTVTTVTNGVTVTTNNDKTGYTASTVSDKTGYSLVTAPLTGSQTADAVLDALTGSHTTAGSVGLAIGSTLTQATTAATQASAAATSSADAVTAIAALPDATDIAIAVLAAAVDGSVTLVQAQSLQLAVMTGKYTTSTTSGTTTTSYYRQDGTTLLAVSVASTVSGTTTRTWTFSNLP